MASHGPPTQNKMRDFVAPADGGSTYCLIDDDQLVKRLTVDARRWFESGVQLNEALVAVTANIALGDNADISSPTGNILLVSREPGSVMSGVSLNRYESGRG